MKRIVLLFTFVATTLLGCIENDLPLPVIVPKITSMEVEGATSVVINSEKREVLITLQEQTDIERVDIKGISFDNDITTMSWNIIGEQDLSKKLSLVLTTYQEYAWTIMAEQPIERYFTIEGQVGASEIDVVNRRVVAYINGAADRRNVKVTSLKLGPKDVTTYSPSISSLKNFTNGVDLTVTSHGRSENWRLFIEQTETVVEFKTLNAWTAVAWVQASGVAGQNNGFKYRKQGDQEWLNVDPKAITSDGGDFSAAIEGLTPTTTYECYAFSGENTTEIRTFTTEEARQMPNSGFEVISNDESSKYYSFYDPASPIAENQTKWWCTGNKGSTTVGSSYSITNPDSNDKQEGNYSVRLESQYVIVKFAAGNIFVGEFDRVIGTSGGVVNFGRPFTLRPRKLSLWLKYENGPIDRFNGAPDNDPVKEGDMDRCQVYVALGDWDYRNYGGTPDCPVQINTTDRSTFFEPDGENVIGYGSYITNKSTNGWIKVEIPIDYTSTSRKPTHIIVSCAASMLGDYFTGSTESTLWVDDIQLHY